MLREKADAEDRGEDTERKKNWEYTIEENDAWEKKMKRKVGRGDSDFNGKLFSLCLVLGISPLNWQL